VTEEERIAEIIRRLVDKYGSGDKIYLNHENPWQLLFATILSAQCTDARVNIVTKALYAKYPTLESIADADHHEFEEMIRPAGLYHSKAKNILACAKVLIEKYNGKVPSDIDEFTSLPGVGRKTANVIRGNIFGIPSIVVDTHVKRISNKLGITDESDPVKIEHDLYRKLPESAWILWNIDIIALGRNICFARKPKCRECFLRDLCPLGTDDVV
jgi:endonuclease-3